MKMSELKTMVNAKTGSVFYVLGENSQYVCSIRLFIEGNEQHIPALYFRLRVDKAPTFTSKHAHLKETFTEDFPGVLWSRVTSSYGSVLGSFAFGCAISDLVKLLTLYHSNSLAGHIYQYLMAHFSEVGFQFSEAEFGKFCNEYVNTLVTALQAQMPHLGKGQVLYTTPDMAVVLQDGHPIQMVDVQDMDGPLSSVAPTSCDGDIASL